MSRLIQIGNVKTTKCILGVLTFNLIAPHLGPLPRGERDRVRGNFIGKINAVY